MTINYIIFKDEEEAEEEDEMWTKADQPKTLVSENNAAVNFLGFLFLSNHPRCGAERLAIQK